MSYEAAYSISLFNAKNRESLHKEFKISTHNDQPRAEIKYIHEKITKDQQLNLDLIKFAAEDLNSKKAGEVLREIFYRKSFKDIQIIEISDLLQKAEIDNKYPDLEFMYPDQFEIYNHVKIDSQSNIALIKQQLELLTTGLKKQWIKIDARFAEDIEQKLSQDFEQYENLDYGYCESELVLFDILAFIKYSLLYIAKNPEAEMYYTQISHENFNCSGKAYEIIEEQLS